jgi:hypothetical protein
MTTLPIRRITLYKHGVGYFERRGTLHGTRVSLSFPRPAMDDMLKSLVALDMGTGQVLSVDFETPEDRAALLSRGSIHLSDDHSMLDLIRDLRGRQVRCLVELEHDDDEQTGLNFPDRTREVEGLVVGAQIDKSRDGLKTLGYASRLLIYQTDAARVVAIRAQDVLNLDILDDKATADLSYFLRTTQGEEEHRSATLHLSEGEHDLLVGYIAPAPAWRVSYRMLFEYEAAPAPAAESASLPATGAPGSVLLQGWGLFDNQLEEDLHDVQLTLVAGMPVSFRYRLYEPHTPERPLVQDEERTVGSPIFYESAPPPAPQAASAKKQRRGGRAMAMPAMAAADTDMAYEEADEIAAFSLSDISAAELEEAVEVSATGGERGSLFAYEVGHPVSVARGQSAMVPILSQRIPCRRELLYNAQKLPVHPVASLRMHNETTLTLERGPVTVLEDGSYAGEAVVPFTLAEAEVIVPYAVELGIKVEEKNRNSRQITSIVVRNDYLLIEEYDISSRYYHLTSTLSKQVDVTIEHSYRSDYHLTETPEPLERTASFARWSVACAANARTTFEVHERKLTSRHESVRSLTGKKLQQYARNRFLDEATLHALEGVLDIYRQVNETQQRIGQIQRERESIYKQQKQIQGNLGPLARDGEEGKLRARYVAELNRLEDTLKNLDSEEQRLKQRTAELERQAQVQLKRLQGT